MSEVNSKETRGVCPRLFLLALVLCFLTIADWRLPIADYFELTSSLSAAQRRQFGEQVSGIAKGAALRGSPSESKWGAHRRTALQMFEDTGGRSRHHEQTAGAAGRRRTLVLNENAQRELLRRAPMEFTHASDESQVLMSLPMPVEESPVMAAGLAARFPNIKTYRGRGLDDPTATTRFDVTPAGLHAIVLTGEGLVIIEPATHGLPGEYSSYIQRHAAQDAGSFSCLLLGAEQARPLSKQLPRTGTLGVFAGTELRTYRLALAATAEFTQTYGGGTLDGALSRMTTLINAVNAIYERDLGIHLMLVANETSIIFTNPATDGYTSNEVTPMLTQNQAILDQRIGPANYDLGMVMDGRVFSPGLGFVFQGAANYQSLCVSGRKGTAVTVLRSTEPSTISAIWVAAHELGHMLGALHTFNSTLDDCGPSRFSQAAYEPGSGSTIMGYRGGVLPDGSYFPICFGDDLLSTDTYFHTFSIEQIFDFTTFGNGSSCPVLTDTGNTPPSVDAGRIIRFPLTHPSHLRRLPVTSMRTR